jgi:hypothetical protein
VDLDGQIEVSNEVKGCFLDLLTDVGPPTRFRLSHIEYFRVH